MEKEKTCLDNFTSYISTLLTIYVFLNPFRKLAFGSNNASVFGRRVKCAGAGATKVKMMNFH